MEIIINGADGYMGHILKERIEASEGLKVCYEAGIQEGYRSLSSCNKAADVVIDFSDHKALQELLYYCLRHHTPVVIATTGHTEQEKELITKASEEIPVFYSANMSVGVAVLVKLIAKAMEKFPDADVEIIETHHNRKKDVPSGTALMLAEAARQVRDDVYFVTGRNSFGSRGKQEIGIHSVRLGNEVGTHEVILSAGSQNLVLRHEARDRSLFADGAIQAAAFIVNMPPGLYTMKDMIS